MKWKKRGVIWKPSGDNPWARSHAAVATPYLRDPDTIRIYLTCRDAEDRGRPMFIDVSAKDPALILRESESPLLDVGEGGCFDDHGVLVSSVVNIEDGRTFFYYTGFEILHTVRYRMLVGLAVSFDGGETASRYKTTPVLERSPAERLFRCAPFVLFDDNTFKMWYVAGSHFEMVRGKELPHYNLRYQESADGINWSDEGSVSLQLTGEDEHGFGRPFVVRCGRTGMFRLFYSIRRRSLGAYRLGYAESSNGIEWLRKDDEMGLDVSPEGPDSAAVSFSAYVEAHGKAYCFYNGNGYGLDGLFLAELVDD